MHHIKYHWIFSRHIIFLDLSLMTCLITFITFSVIKMKRMISISDKSGYQELWLPFVKRCNFFFSYHSFYVFLFIYIFSKSAKKHIFFRSFNGKENFLFVIHLTTHINMKVICVFMSVIVYFICIDEIFYFEKIFVYFYFLLYSI